MSVEPIGIVALVVGLWCLADQRWSMSAFIVGALLGSAAALLIGGATIQPAHLLLGFAAVAIFRNRRDAGLAVASLMPGRPGFWLLALVVYGILSGIIMPRLLAGMTLIIPLGSTGKDASGGLPLEPVSSNVTQAIYITGDLVCFALVYAFASTRKGLDTVVVALLAFATGNVLFALVDLVTYGTGTQDLLDIIRNAQYVLHDEEEIAGLKRIVGSFPEASAFAHATLGAFGFVATLWLCRRRERWTGPLALASLVLLVLSTSSTGLVGAAAALVILYATALERCGTHPLCANSSAAVLLAPLLGLAAGLCVLLSDSLSATVFHYLDMLIFSKSGSSSGMERAAWNTFAIRNFWESNGLGVGLGTVRTSSFPVALLSNVGVPGTAFYVLFTVTILWHRGGDPLSPLADIRRAARNGCLSLIAGDGVAAPTVEQGLLFFTLAALACATPEAEREPLPAAATPRWLHLGGPAGQPSGGPAPRPNT